ncbi:MAG: LamG domain-containing protein [Acidimicrobiaceae bacterium]|nr:LamG domain-containing protein [Acidimicrobiaceae bacterium]
MPGSTWTDTARTRRDNYETGQPWIPDNGRGRTVTIPPPVSGQPISAVPFDRIFYVSLPGQTNPQAYEACVTALNPLARWKFDDEPGSATIAESCDNQDGTPSGGITLGSMLVAGQKMGASFDGTSGFISIPASAVSSAFANQTAYALLLWIATTRASAQFILSSDNAISWRLFSGQTPGQAAWAFPGIAGSTGPIINDGSPHLLALGVAGGEISWFLDGNLTSSGPAYPSAQAATTAAIGQSGAGTQFFQGQIADLIFARSITADQIADLYDAGIGARFYLYPPGSQSPSQPDRPSPIVIRQGEDDAIYVPAGAALVPVYSFDQAPNLNVKAV